ncbi:hypothetical protein ACFQS3_05700 [Glycomyces mayteni]|uniref:Uncharacterized protein n=1 Tax=Glycomyces mayteni TaxID=543887 RepID=A0ABW2D6E9_9ACTN
MNFDPEQRLPKAAIIGSFRKHYKEVVDAALKFESSSISVLSPPVSRIVDPKANFVRFETDALDSTDHQIQTETFARIFKSDFVYVVTPGGYIGRTTCFELGRILERGIPVFYSEEPDDLPISIASESVCSVDELVIRMRTVEVRSSLCR